MVADGRKVAESLQGPRRAELLQLCNDVERLTDQLADLCRKGQVREHSSQGPWGGAIYPVDQISASSSVIRF